MSKYILPLLIAALFLIVPACSIKEDRSSCPALLELDMSRCEDCSRNVMVSVSGSGAGFRQYYYPGISSTRPQFDVPKGVLRISAVTEPRHCIIDDMVLSIPEGTACDSLFAFYHQIDVVKDISMDSVILHKQFAVITLDLSGLPYCEEHCDFVISGNVSGINLIGLTPLEGPFDVRLKGEGKGIYSVSLPRQRDDTLRLDIYGADGLKSSYAIGSYLREAGFDWNAEDLADATVILKTVETDVSVLIRDWLTGSVIFVEI